VRGGVIGVGGLRGATDCAPPISGRGSGVSDLTTTWGYDPAGNVTTIGRPDGKLQWKTYDALNRVKTDRVQRQATGNPPPPPIDLTTWFTYHPSGTIQKVKDARGKETTFEYDESDRKTKMIYPYPFNTHYQQWTYDNAGNLSSRRTVGGQTQSFTYDNRNRKTEMRWDNNAEWAQFGYDDASRLTLAKNGTGAWNTNLISTVTRQYDDANRLTLDRQAVNGLAAKDVNYVTYDNDGKLTRMTVTGASYDYTFSYDLMGRFEKILPTGGGTAFQYYYDVASNETERRNFMTNPNVRQIYTPDSLNRMSRLDVKKNIAPPNAVAAEVYAFDRMSRLTGVNRWPENKQDLFFYYWDGDMLGAQYGVTGPEMPEGGDPDQDMPDTINPWAGWAGAQEAEGIEPPPFQEEGEPMAPVVEEPTVPMDRWVSYFLDNAGNRTRVVETGVHKLYSPNNLNQYTQAEGIGVGNGSQHEVSSYQNVSYYYINDERLKQVTCGNNNYYLYYDALGRCVKRKLNNVTTFYIYDGEKPILEYNSAGSLVGRNVYGKWIDEILRREYGGQSYFFQQDRNHNVTHLTNGSGTVVEKYKYDAFGAVTIYDGSGNQLNYSGFNNRFYFTGREYAAWSATGYNAGFRFYEYRARAYSPTLGRFMSEDPKGFDAGDYNLFRYVHNDPLDLTDPMGLDAVDNGDGTFHFVVRSDLNLNNLRGTHITHPIKGYTEQCPTSAQFLTGTVKGGKLYDAPRTSTWTRGEAVGPNTKPGTMIARGWEFKDGKWGYPSKPPAAYTDRSKINHVATLKDPAKGSGDIRVFDQMKGKGGELSERWYSREGWHVVNSTQAHDRNPSQSAPRAKPVKEPTGDTTSSAQNGIQILSAGLVESACTQAYSGDGFGGGLGGNGIHFGSTRP
jgi:RHS repeat-associated protein